MVPPAGSVVNPLIVAWLAVKVTGVLLVLCIVTDCAPGVSAPGTPANIRPVGWTIGPILLPAGSTVKTIETNCGLLVAPGADTSTVPKYVPALRPVGSISTPTIGTNATLASVCPLWGNAASHCPPEIVLLEMVHGIMPEPVL